MRLSGNGSVQQLEKDKQRGRCRRWRLYQRTDDGSQHTRRFEGTYRQALEALAAFRDELAGQVPNEDTFEAYAMSWHAYRAASGQYAPGTMQNDLRNIRALCRTRLGACAWMPYRPMTAAPPYSMLATTRRAAGCSQARR